jgi:hypothetical protein
MEVFMIPGAGFSDGTYNKACNSLCDFQKRCYECRKKDSATLCPNLQEASRGVFATVHVAYGCASFECKHLDTYFRRCSYIGSLGAHGRVGEEGAY